MSVEDVLVRCSFPAEGTDVTCAVSGGADSLALLVLACAARLNVTAVHVDHGIRAGSGRDVDVVESVAGRFGAGLVVHRLSVDPGPNLEARARKARRDVLPPGAMTGHTADDQVETILLSMVRGAGLNGLAGMQPGHHHPILALRRHETRKLCAELGLQPVHDPSNDDPAFRRNRVRHEVIPLLDDVAGRDVTAVIASQAANLRADAALLDRMAAEIDAADVAALLTAPDALARRAIRAWLDGWIFDRLGELHPPDAASVERVLRVARGETPVCELAGGLQIRRRGNRLERARPSLGPGSPAQPTA